MARRLVNQPSCGGPKGTRAALSVRAVTRPHRGDPGHTAQPSYLLSLNHACSSRRSPRDALVDSLSSGKRSCPDVPSGTPLSLWKNSQAGPPVGPRPLRVGYRRLTPVSLSAAGTGTASPRAASRWAGWKAGHLAWARRAPRSRGSVPPAGALQRLRARDSAPTDGASSANGRGRCAPLYAPRLSLSTCFLHLYAMTFYLDKYIENQSVIFLF